MQWCANTISIVCAESSEMSLLCRVMKLCKCLLVAEGTFRLILHNCYGTPIMAAQASLVIQKCHGNMM